MPPPQKRKSAGGAGGGEAEQGGGGKKARPNASITSFFRASGSVASGGNASTTAAATVPSSTGIPATICSSSSTTTTTGTTLPGTTSTSSLVPVSGAAPKFDKAAWAAKLSAEVRDLLALEIESMHESWLAALREEVVSGEFLALKRFLRAEKEAGKVVFPREAEIYSWSRHTPLPNVKVVILGQDPYHNVNQAHGLCFSVRPPTKAPPSLANMYIALKKDYPSFEPPPNKTGLLTPWADRGVLLLNTCLTVRAHEANSHANRGWERFTQKVIDVVAKKRTKGVVFLAWGTPAGKRVSKVDKERHCVLQSVHPSPLSAARGFFDCGHFKKTNEWLTQRYGEDEEIDWNLNIPAAVAGL